MYQWIGGNHGGRNLQMLQHIRWHLINLQLLVDNCAAINTNKFVHCQFFYTHKCDLIFLWFPVINITFFCQKSNNTHSLIETLKWSSGEKKCCKYSFRLLPHIQQHWREKCNNMSWLPFITVNTAAILNYIFTQSSYIPNGFNFLLLIAALTLVVLLSIAVAAETFPRHQYISWRIHTKNIKMYHRYDPNKNDNWNIFLTFLEAKTWQRWSIKC